MRRLVLRSDEAACARKVRRQQQRNDFERSGALRGEQCSGYAEQCGHSSIGHFRKGRGEAKRGRGVRSEARNSCGQVRCRRVVGAVGSFRVGSGMLGGPRCAGLCDEWWRCAANCGGFRGSSGSMLRCAAKCGEVGDPKCVTWGDVVAKAGGCGVEWGRLRRIGVA